jgi:hypothetical protein
MENIETGMVVVAATEGDNAKLVKGEVIKVASGWVTVKTDDGEEFKFRKGDLEPAAADGEEMTSAHNMAAKLQAARERYTKVQRGNRTSFHNGDIVAQCLNGLELYDVFKVWALLSGESAEVIRTKYEHLNPGQQRMNTGNRIRRLIKEDASLIEKLTKATGYKEAA